jgi:hypothetical protein
MNYKVKGLIRDPFERVSATTNILVKDLHIPWDLSPIPKAINECEQIFAQPRHENSSKRLNILI